MGHDPLAGEILVDQAVVDAMRRSFEDAERRYAINDGSREPRWHFRRGEEGVVRSELGWNSLQATVFEGDPAICGYLVIVSVCVEHTQSMSGLILPFPRCAALRRR